MWRSACFTDNCRGETWSSNLNKDRATFEGVANRPPRRGRNSCLPGESVVSRVVGEYYLRSSHRSALGFDEFEIGESRQFNRRSEGREHELAALDAVAQNRGVARVNDLSKGA